MWFLVKGITSPLTSQEAFIFFTECFMSAHAWGSDRWETEGGGWATHHADVEGVEQVKGQSGHQVNDEPGGHVVDADETRFEDHLTRLADVGGAETADNVCPVGGDRKQREALERTTRKTTRIRA